MSTVISENTAVLNTIAASGGDITLTAGKLNITGFAAPIPYLAINNINGSIRGFLSEDAQVYQVAYTVQNNTTYEFTMLQLIDNVQRVFTVTYISDATATTAEISAALVAGVNANGNGIQATATGSSSPITITASAGYPLLNITSGQNTTVTNYMPSASTSAGSGQTRLPNVISALAGTTTVTVTSTAHLLTTGTTVFISGYGGTMAVNGGTGISGTSGIRARITQATANTFTLDNVVGASLTLSSTVVTVVAQPNFGYGPDLITAGLSTAVSTNYYSLIQLDYDARANYLSSIAQFQGPVRQGLWVNAAAIATPNTAATNYANFAIAFNERMNNYTPSTTNADPESVALK